MELKLKDKIIQILIKNQKMSINEISKETNTYYSYIHKLIKSMEKEGILHIKKFKIKNKQITQVILDENYKNKWINDLKKLLKNLVKNAEVKISIILLCFSFFYNYFKENEKSPKNSIESYYLARGVATDEAATSQTIIYNNNNGFFEDNLNKIIVIIIILLISILIIKKIRKKIKY